MGRYSSAPVRIAREGVEHGFREAVEIALNDFKNATPEEKPAAAKRLGDALQALSAFLAGAELPPE